MGEQVIVAPQEGENTDRSKRRFAQRHYHFKKKLEYIAPFHISRFLQFHRKPANISPQYHNSERKVSCYLRQYDCQ